LRYPILAALLHGTRALGVSQTLWRCIFGKALAIGPHFSFLLHYSFLFSGSMQQPNLAVCQLLGASKYSFASRITFYTVSVPTNEIMILTA